MTPPPTVPLARLFAMAYRDLVDDLHRELRTRGWHDVRPAYGFVLLAARDGPTSATALAGLMGVSKQATSKLVDDMAGGGYVTRGASADDARQRPVALTRRGHDLLTDVEQIHRGLEDDWAGLVGRAELDRVREVLTRVLRARHGGDLPAVRPPW